MSAEVAMPIGERIAAYWRLLHPVPSLMTVLAAGAFVLLAAKGLPPLGLLVHLLAIETAMQFSISALNDYFDRQADIGRRQARSDGHYQPSCRVGAGGSLRGSGHLTG